MGKKKAEKAKRSPEVAAAARRIQRVLERRSGPDEPGLLFVVNDCELSAAEDALEAVYNMPAGFCTDGNVERRSAPGAFVLYQRARYDDDHMDVEADYFQQFPEIYASEREASLTKIAGLEAQIVALRHDIETTQGEIDGIKDDSE